MTRDQAETEAQTRNADSASTGLIWAAYRRFSSADSSKDWDIACGSLRVRASSLGDSEPYCPALPVGPAEFNQFDVWGR